MNMKMNNAEIELVTSDLFRQFARKQSVMQLDDLDIVLYYLKLKDIEKRKSGDKFNLGWFLNEVRQQARV